MHARTARFGYAGDASELARWAETGMLPIYQSQPGFKAYSLIDTGDEIVTFSVCDSAQDAEAAIAATASWVAENMADKLELRETSVGEVVLSTTLGVSSSAAVARS
jgi:hypothetical protein